MTSLMMKKYFLCLFFVVSVINIDEVFAFPQEDCPGVLLTTLDKDHQRFRELSPEAQNMLQIASIIAQVTHSNNSIPAKVNIYHVLLAALTKIQSANESIHRLNLEDLAGDGENKSALFVVLESLGILRDFQRFLLEEIGLNSSNPEPFEFQSDGLLLLNLNEAVLTSIKIDYDEEFDRLWNLAIREKEEEIRNIHRQNGRILQLSNTEDAVRYINIRDKTKRYDKTFRIPTFPEHFFLASLNVDSSPFHFLSEYFNGKTPAQIKDILFPLIDQARRAFWNFSKKKKHNSYTKEEKAQAIALVIKREKEIGVLKKAVAEIAVLKKIPFNTLNTLVRKYKKEHKLSKSQKTYSEAEKEEAIRLVIEREKEIGLLKTIVEVAEEKNIPHRTLGNWITAYRKKHKLSKLPTYSEAEKTEAINLVIERSKEIGVEKTIVEVAEKKNISHGTLNDWVYKYKRDHKLSKSPKKYSEAEKEEAVALVIKREKEIGIIKAVTEVAKQRNIHSGTLYNWVKAYKKKHKLSKSKKTYSEKEKAQAIALVIKREKEIGVLKKAVAEIAELKNIPVNTLSNWVFKHKKDHKLSKNQKKYSEAEKEEAIALVVKREKEVKISKAIVEVAEQTGIPVGTLTHWFYTYKKNNN